MPTIIFLKEFPRNGIPLLTCRPQKLFPHDVSVKKMVSSVGSIHSNLSSEDVSLWVYLGHKCSIQSSLSVCPSSGFCLVTWLTKPKIASKINEGKRSRLVNFLVDWNFEFIVSIGLYTLSLFLSKSPAQNLSVGCVLTTHYFLFRRSNEITETASLIIDDYFFLINYVNHIIIVNNLRRDQYKINTAPQAIYILSIFFIYIQTYGINCIYFWK